MNVNNMKVPHTVEQNGATTVATSKMTKYTNELRQVCNYFPNSIVLVSKMVQFISSFRENIL